MSILEQSLLYWENKWSNMQRIRRVIDNHNKLVRACHKEVFPIQDLKLMPSKIVKQIRNKRKLCNNNRGWI